MELVAVLDNDSLQEIWTGTDLMQVSVMESSKATRYAVEDGTNRNDHVIHNPTEISLRAVMTGEVTQLFDALRQTYRDRSLVTIQTKTAVYANMLLEEIPHDQDPGMTDAVALDLRFVEWREVAPEYGELTQSQVADPKQSDTVRRGSQATTETPPARRQSVLRSLFDA